MINECVVAAKKHKNGCYAIKNRDRTYAPELYIVHYTLPDLELLLTYDAGTKYIEGVNATTGIAIINSALENKIDATDEVSDEGRNILRALVTSNNVADVFRSLGSAEYPVYGHSLVCTKDYFCIFEYAKDKLPQGRRYDELDKYAVRTNHGDKLAAGYTPENDDNYMSSQARKAAGEVIMAYNDSFDDVLQSMSYPVYGDLNVINPNRDTDYMKTRSQLGIDMGNKKMKVVDIPGRQKRCKYMRMGDKNIKPSFNFEFENYSEPSDAPYLTWGLQ
jgi:hypothetical protein